jgi:hypothetical protein
MLSPENVIKAINKATEPFLTEGGSSFSLVKHNNRTLRLRISDNASTAFNNYGNDGEQVNVVKWFESFWLFVEIQFLNPKGTIISLSVFQGEETDPLKTQLFRAEWDDYEDGSNSHPQPHWHFLTNKMVENNAKGFAELLAEEKETFEAFLDEEINKVIDLSKFHFAMNADWTNSKLHVHTLKNEDVLASWFGGLLGYLKNELQFLNNKKAMPNS